MNNQKKAILLVSMGQYGKHKDSYKYCQYLNSYYNITYICFDKGLKKIEDETDIVYLETTGSAIKDTFKMIKASRALIKKRDYQLVFILYFMLSSLVKVFLDNNFILDIRTGAIDKQRLKRLKFDFMLRFEANFFKNITILSESLREKLKIDSSKSTIIPLGSDILSSKTKVYKDLHLLYIGTLTQRDIHKTVYGLAKFIEENRDKNIKVTYDIFGDGFKKETQLLKQSIEDSNLGDIITYHGRKEHDEIQHYFDKCNIGISYIPMTEYFDCQPPTKTFEYIYSGMICLATNTKENRYIINSDNGILFNDNPDAFKDVLEKVYKNISNYQTDIIISSLKGYTWESITKDKLLPFLESTISTHYENILCKKV